MRKRRPYDGKAPRRSDQSKPTSRTIRGYI
jgi:hypothetical protein